MILSVTTYVFYRKSRSLWGATFENRKNSSAHVGVVTHTTTRLFMKRIRKPDSASFTSRCVGALSIEKGWKMLTLETKVTSTRYSRNDEKSTSPKKIPEALATTASPPHVALIYPSSTCMGEYKYEKTEAESQSWEKFDWKIDVFFHTSIFLVGSRCFCEYLVKDSSLWASEFW